MSSEVHKYIEKAIDSKKSLLKAEILSFPNDEEKKNFRSIKTEIKCNIKVT